MSKIFFSGTTTALITPFKKGKVDFKSLKKLISFQLDHGILGFVVCGSTGEAATLRFEEKEDLLDFVLSEVAGQVPVLMGTGTNNTQETAKLTRYFSKKKIQGFLIVTPYYNKPPQRGLVEHFTNVAKETTKPVLLYNVPGRTAIALEPETVKELSKIKNIVGIKEATGDLKIIKQLIQILPRDFSIISGDDETFLLASKLGAHGVISVISHVAPKLCVAADMKDLKKIKKLSELVFVESNPIPVKWILKEMGIISSAELRLPLVPLKKSYEKHLKAKLKELEVL